MTKEDIIQIVKDFLKENLTVSVDNELRITVDNPVNISIYLCGEKIDCASENDEKHSEGWYWT